LDELKRDAAQCACSPFFSREVARVSRDSHDDRLEPLILDLIEWLLAGPRPYAEVMEAWRTTCARLPVWEEAVDRGLVVSEMAAPGRVLVTVTSAGRRFFAMRRLVAC
jgi:hypothetical protein